MLAIETIPPPRPTATPPGIAPPPTHAQTPPFTSYNPPNPSGPDTPHPTPDTPFFSPSPEDFSLIINQLANPHTSFSDLAESHNTTVEALSLFLARPDIQERINALHAALAARVRLVSTNHLIAASGALKLIIDGYSHEERNVPINPRSLQASEQRRRSRETARRAASLLYRLARFQHTPLMAPVEGDSVGRASCPPSSPPVERASRPFDSTMDRSSVARPSRPDTPTPLTQENPGTQPLGPAPVNSEAAAPASLSPAPLSSSPSFSCPISPSSETSNLKLTSVSLPTPPDTPNPTPHTPSPEDDPFSDIATGQLVHPARLSAAQLLRSLGDTSPRAFYGQAAATGPAP